jgi:tubulin delta
MSIVTVQIGQCGNQIGEKLFETLIADNSYNFNSQKSQFKTHLNENYVQESEHRFFTRDDDDYNNKSPLYARSILIDMESKVVNKLLNNNNSLKGFIFRDKNSYTQKKGSGNNWSYGYCVNGPQSLPKVKEIIRKEAERCDRLASFFICMSLAGGTGSGVGSFYTEYLRDEYPRTTIVNNCVWPFSTGEVILQNYNFLLTLNKLYEHADALILHENDSLNQICKRIYNIIDSKKSTCSKKEINFDDLNAIIGHQLASIIQPSCSAFESKNYLNDLVSDLCSHNDFKLLSLNHFPHLSKQAIEFSSFQWGGLYKSAARELMFNQNECEINSSIVKMISMSLFARGGVKSSFDEQNEIMRSYFDANYTRKTFTSDLLGDAYLLLCSPIRLWYHERMFNSYEKSLSVLCNSQLPALKIDSQIVNKAWKMYSSKAYLHQYLRYESFEGEDMLNAFIFAEQLIKNYRKL